MVQPAFIRVEGVGQTYTAVVARRPHKANDLHVSVEQLLRRRAAFLHVRGYAGDVREEAIRLEPGTRCMYDVSIRTQRLVLQRLEQEARMVELFHPHRFITASSPAYRSRR